jgi:2-isopropylmalate synthase
LFQRLKDIKLKRAKVAAFGSTCRKNVAPEDDSALQGLLAAGSPVVTIFGKAWPLHVERVIKTSAEENLRMIFESVRHAAQAGREVYFDAEHFFDGYAEDPAYALETVRTAARAGARCAALCDTNGGRFPEEIAEAVKAVRAALDLPLGIHCHNDCGMAVASSRAAVEAGAVCVQGTLLGFGERCGNANLSTIIPNLQIKRDYKCIPEKSLRKLANISHTVAEIANVSIPKAAPYVGAGAFAHKAGMHADGVSKLPRSFEHVPPESVGNERRFLMSEMAGRAALLTKIRKVAPEIEKDSPEALAIIGRLKNLEGSGYQFEGAESSFELLVRRELGQRFAFFEIERFQTLSEYAGEYAAEAESKGFTATVMVKLRVNGVSAVNAAEGEGPVNALDRALRKTLEQFYPSLHDMRLIDYKVRVLDPESATAAMVRVMITSTDGKATWTTVGVSVDILHASLIALVDSIEYKLSADTALPKEPIFPLGGR